jgi:hypothetical protein
MMDSLKAYLGIALASICSLVGSAYANEASWRLTTGFDASTGEYGTGEETDTVYVPFGVSRQSGNWTLKANSAWVSIDGGSVIGGGDSGIVVPGGQPFDESGVGDTWLNATYALQSFPSDLGYLDLSAKLKVPTADEDKGLGTGEVDYTVQADFFKPMGNWTPMVSLAYKVKGEPDGVDLDNVLYASVGTAYRVSSVTSFGAMVDYQEASVTSADNAQELFAYWSQKVSSDWQFMLYGYAGFSDGSPDQGLGIQLSYRQQ